MNDLLDEVGVGGEGELTEEVHLLLLRHDGEVRLHNEQSLDSLLEAEQLQGELNLDGFHEVVELGLQGGGRVGQHVSSNSAGGGVHSVDGGGDGLDGLVLPSSLSVDLSEHGIDVGVIDSVLKGNGSGVLGDLKGTGEGSVGEILSNTEALTNLDHIGSEGGGTEDRAIGLESELGGGLDLGEVEGLVHLVKLNCGGRSNECGDGNGSLHFWGRVIIISYMPLPAVVYKGIVLIIIPSF